MVKLLLCGDIGGEWITLQNRIDALQKSAHGPFHVLFFCGTLFKDEEEFRTVAPTLNLPITCYAYDRTGVHDDKDLPANLEFLSSNAVGLVTISNLTVGFMRHEADPGDIQDVKDMTNATGYRGCDLLLSNDWPRELHHFIDESDLAELRATGVGLGIGSQAVSSVAAILRPRYHISTGRGVFFQRSPYHNEPMPSGLPTPPTRFIGLGVVSSSKEKSKKWMHALSLEPIIHMTAAELSATLPGTTDCPYVEVGSISAAKRLKDPNSIHPPTTAAVSGGFRPPPPPGPMPAGISQNSGSFFFGRAGQAREGSTTVGASNCGPPAPNLVPPSDKATTLFIGGLGRDLPDYELRKVLPGSVDVRRPPGKSFAFVEFTSHQAAKAVVEASVRRGVVIGGRTISIGWGKEKEKDKDKDREFAAASDISSTMRSPHGILGEHGAGFVVSVHLEPPSAVSKTLFVGSLAPTTTREQLLEIFPHSVEVRRKPGKAFAFVEFESNEMAAAVVKSSQEKEYAVDGKTLAIGWAKDLNQDILPANSGSAAAGEGGHVGHDDLQQRNVTGVKRKLVSLSPPDEQAKTLFVGGLAPTVTTKDLEAFFEDVVDVRRPEGKDFAFVEFATHETALSIMQRGAGEGTVLVLHGKHLSLGWAKGKAPHGAAQNADCWFCLSSPSVKLHLVVSVGEHAYLALPRGGMTDLHCMISPVECVPNRIHFTAVAKTEFARYENAVSDLFDTAGCAPLFFERAIRTPFRDHMQQHCVPIPREKIPIALKVFMQQAENAQMKFNEIQGALGVEDIVQSMEGGPYHEYFYISLPIGDGNRSRRFVYAHVHTDTGKRFPMQFGTQVAAHILGQPHKSNWKDCVVSEEEEENMAAKFRDAFEPYDFNLD